MTLVANSSSSAGWLQVLTTLANFRGDAKCVLHWRYSPKAIFIVVTLLVLVACGDTSKRVVLRGSTMGTTWSLIYVAPPKEATVPAIAPEQLQVLLDAELVAINQALSTYLPNSEISRLNNAAGDISRGLSPSFATVLTTALEVSTLTGGAYDVTVGPLVELWGFGSSDFDGQVPMPEAIAAAQGRVGYQHLRWNPEAARLSRPSAMRVDLSSIAKGYAVDRLYEIVREQGVEHALIEIGGELRALGERPEGGPWRLAVESPDPAQGRFIEALAVADIAVATSGDYRNYFELGGRRYSHLVDPRSGYPVSHELVSVTVVHEQCMVADAFATALIVLGLEEAQRIAEQQRLAVHFVSRSEGGLEVHYSDAFSAFRQRSVNDPEA